MTLVPSGPGPHARASATFRCGTTCSAGAAVPAPVLAPTELPRTEPAAELAADLKLAAAPAPPVMLELPAPPPFQTCAAGSSVSTSRSRGSAGSDTPPGNAIVFTARLSTPSGAAPTRTTLPAPRPSKRALAEATGRTIVGRGRPASDAAMTDGPAAGFELTAAACEPDTMI